MSEHKFWQNADAHITLLWQTLKEYNEFTQAIQAKTPKQKTFADSFKTKVKNPRDSDWITSSSP